MTNIKIMIFTPNIFFDKNYEEKNIFYTLRFRYFGHIFI